MLVSLFSVEHEFSDFNFQCVVVCVCWFFFSVAHTFCEYLAKNHILYVLVISYCLQRTHFKFFLMRVNTFSVCSHKWHVVTTAGRTHTPPNVAWKHNWLCWPLPSSLWHYNRSKCSNVLYTLEEKNSFAHTHAYWLSFTEHENETLKIINI